MNVHTPGHALSPAWPEGFGRVLKGALPPALLEAIVSEAQAVSKSPNFWSSRVSLGKLSPSRDWSLFGLHLGH